MSIELREIDKHFGQYHALQKISLSIQPGELVALLGPSGSGKTSLLRIIAGLETLDEGTILFDQKEVVHLSAKERNIGFVFQHYALFNHMTVFDNVAYGLKVRPKKLRPSKKEIEDKVMELLALVKLEHFAKRYPSQLSGGQRQRVALARALAVEPKVLLLDEPFGALDAKVRKDLRRWLRKLHNDYHITSIFVTHDQEEALAMSDEIFVLNEGNIQQSGTPVDIYDEPINRFVADFIGESNIISGIMVRDFVVNMNGQEFECVDQGLNPNEKVDVVIRPEDLELTTVEQGKLVVTVDSQLFRGVHYELSTFDEAGNEWLVHSLKKADVGAKIGLDFDPESIHIMRLNESEEDFDKRLESYGDDHDEK